MFKHILVPLDGSLLAERTLALAANIVEEMSAKLTLLRVVPQFAILAADPMVYEEMNRLGDEESLSYLRSKADALDLSVSIDVFSETGQPADTIIRFAEEHDVDLIMISSHGRSGLNRWVYGSVAERVLRQSPCATLIINARVVHDVPQCKKILVPLDGSDIAERALEPGKQLAAALGSDLHLLRVTTYAHQMMETSSMKGALDDIEEREVQEAEAYLKSKYSDEPDLQIYFKVDVAKGTVAESIVNYAAEHQINLIVMSSHGRTGLQRWVYGSVAEKVLRSACCATMIIRDKI